MSKKLIKSIFNLKLALLATLVIITIVYQPLLKGFFIQDEWLFFGNHFFSEDKGLLLSAFSYFTPNVAHYVPFTKLFANLLFLVLKLNHFGYALFSIFLHLIVVFLVYVLTSKLFSNKWLPVLSALLFGLSASAHQATSWPIANINTHGSTIFGLLAVIYFVRFTDQKSNNYRNFWMSMVLLVISLFFKETTIGLYITLPIYLLIFSKKAKSVNKKIIILTLSVGLAYVVFRGAMFFLPGEKDAPIVTQSQGTETILQNLINYPIKSHIQSLVPLNLYVDSGYKIASLFPEEITGLKGTTDFDIFAQEGVMEVVSLLFFIGTILLFIKIGLRERRMKIALFGFIFVLLNSFVFAFSPARGDVITIIDSRNLYFLSIGAVIFLISALSVLIKEKRTFAVVVLAILVVNVYYLNKELTKLSEVGQIRLEILEQIKDSYPILPKRVVFYTKSDTNYYGLAEADPILPFQSGLGQTLLVWYKDRQYFPREMFDEEFLYGITDQGYKEIDGVGFGYFRDALLLETALNEYNLTQDNVVSFSWDGNEEVLTSTNAE